MFLLSGAKKIQINKYVNVVWRLFFAQVHKYTLLFIFYYYYIADCSVAKYTLLSEI